MPGSDTTAGPRTQNALFASWVLRTLAETGTRSTQRTTDCARASHEVIRCHRGDLLSTFTAVNKMRVKHPIAYGDSTRHSVSDESHRVVDLLRFTAVNRSTELNRSLHVGTLR